MKRLIKYSSIGQYRNVVKSIQMNARYIGKDDDGKAKYNANIEAPTLEVVASEKIHGTNGSVCYSIPDGFWVQSKENIITVAKDNAGCALWAVTNRDTWLNIIDSLATHYSINLNKYIITVYFEWAGGSIQKKSACTSLDKRAILFQHFKVSPIEPTVQDDENAEDEQAYWLETRLYNDLVSAESSGIYNIMNYKVYRFNVDFENPALSQNQFSEIIAGIEANSPYGEAMGVKDNIGEGIVCTLKYNGKLHKFKVKGEKHAGSKVKTLKVVDEAKELAKIEFANYACSASRLEQAWQTVFGIDNSIMLPDIKATGDIIRTVIKDIMKEELDVMADMGVEPKEVNSKIGLITRRWFIAKLDEEILTPCS